MANFNWLEQWKQVGRKNAHSVFDLSKKMCFTLPNSLIMPVRFIETVPDDHLILNLSGLLRTETFNRAAFFKGKAVFSAFFVPYKQLWHNFNQFVVQKQDRHSNVYKSSNYVPVVDLEKLMYFVSYCCFNDLRDEFGYPVAWQMAQVLQYAKICNLYPIIAHKVQKDLSDTWTSYKAKLKPFFDPYKGKRVNLFRLLAYQHIFYDFYRNKYYDDYAYFSAMNLDPIQYIDTFNVDDINCTNSSDNEIGIDLSNIHDHYDGVFVSMRDARMANILKPHYCQYRKDLYTSLLPSSQFGAVSGISFSGYTGYNGTYDEEGGIEDGPAEFIDSDLTDSAGNVAYHSHLFTGYQDVLAFRNAELLQQWKQNALRAGNMVDDNFESHYGVKPFYEDDNNVRFLGQWECPLDVNPVTATAEGAQLKVGDLGAYGVGAVNGKQLDVQIKDFGVIVICAHFASEVYYSANGIDKQNQLIEPFDFFQSEFENSGLDTYQTINQTMWLNGHDSDVLGYTPPYTYHKTEVDEVFGEYGVTPYYLNPSDGGLIYGSLAAWTVRRSDFFFIGQQGLYYYPVLSVNRFYQSPGLTDSVFGIVYNGQGRSDPFGFAVNIQCTAIRPMSVLGIPVFG